MFCFSARLLCSRNASRAQHSIPLPRGIGGCRFSPRVENVLLDAADHINRTCDKRLGPMWLSLPVMRLLDVSPAPGIPGVRITGWNDTTDATDDGDDADILFNTTCTTHPSLFHANCAAILCIPLSPRRQILFPKNVFETLRGELKRRRRGSGAVSPFWFPVDFLAAMEMEGKSDCSLNSGVLPVSAGETLALSGSRRELQFVNCFDISRGIEISETLMRSKDPEIIFAGGATCVTSAVTLAGAEENDDDALFLTESVNGVPFIALNPNHSTNRDRLLNLPNHRSSDALSTRDFFRLKMIRFQRNLRSEFWCEEGALHTIARRDRVVSSDVTLCSHTNEHAANEDAAFYERLLQKLQPFGVNVTVRCALLPKADNDDVSSTQVKMVRLFNIQDVQNQRSILLHGNNDSPCDSPQRFSRRTALPVTDSVASPPPPPLDSVRLVIEVSREQVLSLNPLVLTTKDKSVRVHMEEFGATLVEAPK